MSFAKSKSIPLADKQWSVFTWGIVDNSEPNLIPYQNTPFGRNFRVNWQGISIAPWFVQVGDNFDSQSNYPRGIWPYLRSNPANDSIIVNYPLDGTHHLVWVDPVTYIQTAITTAGLITSTNRMNFISAQDSLYCMNWVDLIGKLNGTTYSNPIATYKPSFGVWFDNSMFVAGDPAAPNRMYKSAENNAESYSGSGADIFDSSYPVTWLAVAGQTLYVFSETTIDMLNNNSIKQVGTSLVYTSVPLEATEWAVNHNSIVSVGKDVYYLSKSNKIKKVAPNSMLHYDVTELSNRRYQGITKTMKTLDADQTKSFSVHIPDAQLIKWYVKTNGATFNDLCIIYHYEFDEFMADDHRVFYGECWYKTKAFAISQIEPKIYRDEYGTTNDWSLIQFYYRTKNLDFWEPTINKELWQSRTFISLNTLAEVVQNVYANDGLVDTITITKNDIPVVIEGIGTKAVWTFAIWEEETQSDIKLYNVTIVREKWDLQVRAEHFEFEYTCSTLGAQLLLQKLEPRIEMLDQLTTSTNWNTPVTTINLSPLQDSVWNNILDSNWEQIFSIIQTTI